MLNYAVWVSATQWGTTDLSEGTIGLAAEIPVVPVTLHKNELPVSVNLCFYQGNEAPQYYPALPEQHIPVQKLLSCYNKKLI